MACQALICFIFRESRLFRHLSDADAHGPHFQAKLTGILMEYNAVPSAGDCGGNIGCGIIHKEAFFRIQQKAVSEYLVDFPHGFDDFYIAGNQFSVKIMTHGIQRPVAVLGSAGVAQQVQRISGIFQMRIPSERIFRRS